LSFSHFDPTATWGAASEVVARFFSFAGQGMRRSNGRIFLNVAVCYLVISSIFIE
jgi:hypothetical protein